MQQEMAMSTMRKNRDARDGVGWVEGDHEGREGTLEFKELRGTFFERSSFLAWLSFMYVLNAGALIRKQNVRWFAT
jgi:hypothetical protein